MYKIKIKYSKYDHEFKAVLLSLWFTIPKFKLTPCQYNFYTKADFKRGNFFTIKKQIKAWRDLYGNDVKIENFTNKLFNIPV